MSTLVAYFYAKDEAFWLAYFLVLSDGFFGLLGTWEAVFSVIPGLPAIEVVQFYILITLFKARKAPLAKLPFFSMQLNIIFIYLLFLVIQGYVIGLSGALNVQFRVVKYLVPLFLFYSIPRLIKEESQFREIMAYLFPVAFFALGAQLFSITMGREPAQVFGFILGGQDFFEISEEQIYRGLFNFCILIITFFGALYFLSTKDHNFKPLYLTGIIAADYLTVFLSATRGWIIGFSMIIVLYAIFVSTFSFKHLLKTFLAVTLILFVLISIPAVNIQIHNAYNRMWTLDAMAQGDITAGGTLLRLNERGPRVMKKWRESPLTGFGFSDDFFHFADGHVANQNILLHSGIVGAFLMGWFFLYSMEKYFSGALSYPGKIL